MSRSTKHWTDDSTEDYLFAVSSGFVRAIESAMGDTITQSELAERLGVSESRVSQVLNNPGNLTMRKIIEYARALSLNVAIVAYDRSDDNKRGLIPPEIFTKCWEKLGRPADFFEFESCRVVTDARYSIIIEASSQNVYQLEFPIAGVVNAPSPMQPVTGRYYGVAGTVGLVGVGGAGMAGIVALGQTPSSFTWTYKSRSMVPSLGGE